jgi:hypothetical protein
VLSGALKIADEVTVAMEAVGNKFRLNSENTSSRVLEKCVRAFEEEEQTRSEHA